MEQIKFKVNCKRLDGSVQIADVTLSENNEITYVNSETPSPYVGFKVEVVSTLPDTGENGVIYLVPGTGTAPNIYDEYIWVEGNNDFECLGTTEISLEGTFNVIKASEIINNTLTDEQYAEITNGKPTLIEGTFLSGYNNFVLFPPLERTSDFIFEAHYTTGYPALVIGAVQVVKSTKVISLNTNKFFRGEQFDAVSTNRFNNKQVPDYPSSPATDQTLVYKTDNTLAWEDKPAAGKTLYLHKVMLNGSGTNYISWQFYLYFINSSSDLINTYTKIYDHYTECINVVAVSFNNNKLCMGPVFLQPGSSHYPSLVLNIYDKTTSTITSVNDNINSQNTSIVSDTVTEL